MSAADPSPLPLRFAVLTDGAGLAHWQERCLATLAEIAQCLPVATVALPDLMPAPGSIAGLASLEYLASLATDFILCFAEGPLPGALLRLGRHGVWRFHFGDWTSYRGTPGGYWEVFDGCAASAALLVRIQPDPDVVEVLREGCWRTELLSARKNREALQSRVASWPADMCRALLSADAANAADAADVADVAAGGGACATLYTVAGAAPELRRGAPVRPPPGPWQRAQLLVRIALRVARVAFRSLFRHDQWNIGIVDQPIEQFVRPGPRAATTWFAPTRRDELRADPIGVLHGGRPTILCEHFSYRDGIGYIVAMDAAGLGAPGTGAAGPSASGTMTAGQSRVQIGPVPPVHLSYPFVVEDDGRLFCMPESSAAAEIALYELERFPDRWSKRTTLITGRGYVDATVFRYEQRWWLAASEVAAKGANCELHLWFAERLGGPWTAHARNPVKIDVRSARPAGAPFWADGAFYRPAQDCSSTYGARVVLNRVQVLTPHAFREEVAASVEPDRHGRYPAGLHTLSRFGTRTLIDGKRPVFAGAEFRRVLAHYLPRAGRWS